MNVLRKYSQYKIDPNLPPHERKYIVLVNQSFLAGIVGGVFVFASLLGGYLYLIHKDFEKYVSYIWGGIPLIFIYSLQFLLFYLRPKLSHYLWAYFGQGVLVNVFTLLICIFYGSKFEFEYCIIAIVMMAVLVGSNNKPFLLSGIIGCFLAFAFLKILYLFVDPIFKIEEKQVLVFYQIAWNFIFFCLITGLTLISASYTSRIESELFAERQKSDQLLYNVLPVETANELKEFGTARPRKYDKVSIIFTDFVGFTKIAEQLAPEDLIGELDKCFGYFDSVCKKHNLERLKTIGDAYMCAGGLPTPNKTAAIDAALAALEIQRFMNSMKDIKISQGLAYWELRLGLHIGPVISGVVGETKFAYDIWGDTVNTASRMESSGTPGMINISEEIYKEIMFLFDCSFRGKVHAKNKGEINMYYLNTLQRKFATDDSRVVPNARFHEIYDRIAGGAVLRPK